MQSALELPCARQLLDQLLDLGVDSITTDYPDRLNAVLAVRAANQAALAEA